MTTRINRIEFDDATYVLTYGIEPKFIPIPNLNKNLREITLLNEVKFLKCIIRELCPHIQCVTEYLKESEAPKTIEYTKELANLIRNGTIEFSAFHDISHLSVSGNTLHL
jgi:hypothetical protein